MRLHFALFAAGAVLAATSTSQAFDLENFKSTRYAIIEESMSDLLDKGYAIKALSGSDFVLVNERGQHVFCQLLAELDQSLKEVFEGADAVSACFILH